MSVKDLYRYTDEVEKKGFSSGLFYLYYNKNDGFESNEFNGGCQPCALRLQNGLVSLPSINGLVVYEPEQIRPNLPDNPLIVHRIEERGTTRLILGDTVQLEHDPRNIVSHFGTTYFGNSENLYFSYAMTRSGAVPKSADWATVTNSDIAIRFAELGSGRHKLWVRKVNGFGLNNYAVTTVDVFVLLNWYGTLWFKLLTIIFFNRTCLSHFSHAYM